MDNIFASRWLDWIVFQCENICFGNQTTKYQSIKPFTLWNIKNIFISQLFIWWDIVKT